MTSKTLFTDIQLNNAELNILLETLPQNLHIAFTSVEGEQFTMPTPLAISIYEVLESEPQNPDKDLEGLLKKFKEAIEIEPPLEEDCEHCDNSEQSLPLCIDILYLILFFSVPIIGYNLVSLYIPSWLDIYILCILTALIVIINDSREELGVFRTPFLFALSAIVPLKLADILNVSLEISIFQKLEITISQILVLISIIMGLTVAFLKSLKPYFQNNFKLYGNQKHCLACGHSLYANLDYDAWQSICECCGAQVAYTYALDDGAAGAIEYRKHWLNDEKAKWHWENDQPEEWDRGQAIIQIVKNVPDELIDEETRREYQRILDNSNT